MSSEFNDDYINKNINGKITPSLSDIIKFPFKDEDSFTQLPSLTYQSKENIDNIKDLGITPDNKKIQILNKQISTNNITTINSKNNNLKILNSNEETLIIDDNSNILFNISKENSNKKPSLTSLESKNFIDKYKEETKYFSKEQLLIFQEQHLPIPLEKSDDEKFKILSIQKFKNRKKPPFKSAKKYFEDEYMFQKAINEAQEFALLKKKKIVYSTQKNLFIFIPFYNKNLKEYKLPLFKDKDIGIYEYWQAHIQDSQIDEDFDTEDEQSVLAKNFCYKEIKDSILLLKKNGSSIVLNQKYLK